jgi:hypothetical protein
LAGSYGWLLLLACLAGPVGPSPLDGMEEDFGLLAKVLAERGAVPRRPPTPDPPA